MAVHPNSPNTKGRVRLAGDAENPHFCTDCGFEVWHFDAGPDVCDDYFVMCTNTECPHHEGETTGDLDCPAWAHGERPPPRVEPPPGEVVRFVGVRDLRDDPLSTAEFHVLSEVHNQRQQYGLAHDAEHVHGELALVAADLVLSVSPTEYDDSLSPCSWAEVRDSFGKPIPIPWGMKEKFADPRRRMIIAAALLIAEIDRRNAIPGGWVGAWD